MDRSHIKESLRHIVIFVSTCERAQHSLALVHRDGEHGANATPAEQRRSKSTSQLRTLPRAGAPGSRLTDIFSSQSLLEGHQRRPEEPMRSGLEGRSASSERPWMWVVAADARGPIPQPERAMAAALQPLCLPLARRVKGFGPGKTSARPRVSQCHVTSTLLVLPHCCLPHACRVAPACSSAGLPPALLPGGWRSSSAPQNFTRTPRRNHGRGEGAGPAAAIGHGGSRMLVAVV